MLARAPRERRVSHRPLALADVGRLVAGEGEIRVLAVVGQLARQAGDGGAGIGGDPAVGEIGALSLIKLILHPIIIVFVFTSETFGLSREEIVAAVLLAALPVANNVFVIATRYEVRPGRISSTIFATTLLALVSFNLWAWLLQCQPAG